MASSTYFHYFDTFSLDKKEYAAAFAIELRSCPSARLFYDRYQRNDQLINERFSSFIACLYRTDLKVSYRLRLIVKPDERSFSSGEIQFVLLVQLAANEKPFLLEQIAALEKQMLVLLGGSFSDYDWQPIHSKEDFMEVWEPIDWKCSSIAEITRQEEWITIDKIKKASSLGYRDLSLNRENNVDLKKIYYLSPFLSSDIDFECLIQTLLLLPFPTILDVSLIPAILFEEEETAMQDVLAWCEDPSLWDKSIDLKYIFKDRAEMLQRALMNQFERLAVNPMFMRILVASSQRLSPVIMNTIGGYISSFSQGQNLSSSEGMLALQEGGFSTRIFKNGDAEYCHAIQHLEGFNLVALENRQGHTEFQRLKWLFCAREAARAFRFPVATDQNLPGFQVHNYHMQPPPPEIVKLSFENTDQCCQIGLNDFLGQRLPIFIDDHDRLRHVYVVGQTGTGKTTLLKNMIVSDMHSGKGVVVIDPHGDLYDDLLGLIPQERIDDVVLFDPTDMEYPVGFNLLECDNEEDAHFVTREMHGIMEKYFNDKYQYRSVDYTGPIFFRHMEMNMLLLMSDPDKPGTLLDFYELFNQKDFWKKWLPLKCHDPILENWTNVVLPSMDYVSHARPQQASFGEYINSKFQDFVFDPRLRLIFGQRRSTIQIEEVIRSGKILLINLAKGELGETNSNFLGMILMAKIQNEVMKRAELSPEKREPFYLYVDEFQNIAGMNFSLLLSEGRKFGLAMTLANQYMTQLEGNKVLNAIFGNVGTFITFRISPEDAQKIATLYQPDVDSSDLCDLPNWTSAVRASCRGVTSAPFLMRNIYRKETRNEELARMVRERSRQRYARPRAEVERIIDPDAELKKNVEALKEALKDL